MTQFQKIKYKINEHNGLTVDDLAQYVMQLCDQMDNILTITSHHGKILELLNQQTIDIYKLITMMESNKKLEKLIPK